MPSARMKCWAGESGGLTPISSAATREEKDLVSHSSARVEVKTGACGGAHDEH